MPSASDGEHPPPPIPSKRTKDIPLLLPSGRKLRHLNGVALRNLSQKPPSTTRPRGRSTDDEAIATTWRSPGKSALKAHAEEEAVRRLERCRSSGDLVSAAKLSGDENNNNNNNNSNNDGDSKVLETDVERPALGKLKRRSTRGNPVGLESPHLRQKRLEEVTAGNMADVFFSLHTVRDDENPVYVSEIVKKSMNPNFQSLELSDCGPAVTRLDRVIVKIWANPSDQFQLLVELDIQLKALQYIGKNLEDFRTPLPANCIIFFLSDGCYTNFTDLPPRDIGIGHISSASVSSVKSCNVDNLIPTSSYDAIMKLNTLEDCIQDALQTTARVSKTICSVLAREAHPLSILKEKAQALERRNVVQKSLAAEKKRLESAIRTRANLKKSLDARREAMRNGRESQQTGEKYLEEAGKKLERCKNDVAQTRIGLEGQKRRIVEDLQKIYPIEPIPGEPLGFKIRDLYLPNTNHENYNEEKTSAALGYIAHVVYLLSFYLGSYLRYPVQYIGSNSFVQDPISVIQGARTFPLWSKGSIYYRFEYAIFLLNKDIEQLMSSQSLLVMDLRHTLPNLKYLLLFVTSGNNPMPDRERPSSPSIRMLRKSSSSSTTATITNTTHKNSSLNSPDNYSNSNNPHQSIHKNHHHHHHDNRLKNGAGAGAGGENKRTSSTSNTLQVPSTSPGSNSNSNGNNSNKRSNTTTTTTTTTTTSPLGNMEGYVTMIRSGS